MKEADLKKFETNLKEGEDVEFAVIYSIREYDI